MLLSTVATSDLLFTFFVLLLMVFITYLGTKIIAKTYGNTSGKKIRSFHILDRMQITRDSSLLIVKVGEKVILLGVTSQSINKICDLDNEFLNIEEIISTPEQMTFTEALMKNLKSNFVKEENKDFDEK